MDNMENIINQNEETQAAEAQPEVEEVEEKPYTLRRLKDRDLWPILDILNKVFPDDLGTIFVSLAAGEKTMREIGAFSAARLVVAMRNLDKIHDELYEFLSDVSGIPAGDIPEMAFGTTPAMLLDIFKNERNAGFFKVLSKLS